MKPKMKVVADEMFPEGVEAVDTWMETDDGVTHEKLVHSDFFNDFDDLCDDEDIQ